MKMSNFEIYVKPFFYNDKALVFPELWESPEWNDLCFNTNIKPYVENQFSSETYANDEFLKIIDINFFTSLEKCKFLTIFTSVPDDIKLSYESRVCLESIYDDVLNNLVFLGWNPRCEIASAITEGLYPIEVRNKNAIFEDFTLDVSINQYGLIKDMASCQNICEINNTYERNQDFWFVSGIYVDKYTYKLL